MQFKKYIHTSWSIEFSYNFKFSHICSHLFLALVVFICVLGLAHLAALGRLSPSYEGAQAAVLGKGHMQSPCAPAGSLPTTR